MSDVLNQMEARLQAVTSCPVCQSRRLEYWRAEEFGPPIDDPDELLTLPQQDDKAASRFWCGAILFLGKREMIEIRRECPMATQVAVKELNRPINADIKEKAA
ncbi:hypothetical protein ASF91_15180 [Rhizobium sp. Leaf155]|nr:hypothetical protein ASF91_15180 [Rhizobium sp. Leaf155]